LKIKTLFLLTIFCSMVNVGICKTANALTPPSENIPNQPKKIELTTEQRQQALKEMEVWHQVDVTQQDFGSSGSKYENWETINCKFNEPTEKPGGATQKFYCANEDDDNIKVKYGNENSEVYSEIIGSRLLKGMGFYADDNYPVRVVCDDCPPDPWNYINYKTTPIQNSLDTARLTEGGFDREKRIFIPANVEKKFSKTELVSGKKEGFGLTEMLDTPGITEDQKIDREALAIMAAFMQHEDSKPDNQRLACPNDAVVMGTDGEYTCTKPIGLIHDIGYTFGRGRYYIAQTSRADLEGWKKAPVFKNPDKCEIQVYQNPIGTLGTRKVSKESKNLVSILLRQMSDSQIFDLFHTTRPYMQHPIGTDYDAVTQDWVDTFKAKRDEVTNATCENSPVVY
jgi:hypothetical protein